MKSKASNWFACAPTSILGLAATLALLLPIGAAAAPSEVCLSATRAASQLAQDYRLAVGKARTACDSTSEECLQRQAQANEIFVQLDSAHHALLVACQFAGPNIDDSLPVTAATVATAIDLLPQSVLFGGFQVSVNPFIFVGIGQDLLGLQISDVVVSGDTSTWFNYRLIVTVTAANVAVNTSRGEVCEIRFISGVAPITGTAYFSASNAGGNINRLQLDANQQFPLHAGITQFDHSCTGVEEISDLMISQIRQQFNDVIDLMLPIALNRRFCGATGPELFGPCS